MFVRLRHHAVLVLLRLEGFKEPWDVAVYKGKAVSGDKTLEEAGVSADAPLVTVRRVLLPEGKPISDMLNYSADSTTFGANIVN